MRTVVDQRYLEERQRFNLRATCEFCQHHNRKLALCSLGFPTKPHEEKTHQSVPLGKSIFFCKYFEME